MKYSTRQLRASEPWVAFNADGVPEEDVEWLLRFFTESLKSGVRFQESETIQIGWAVDRVAKGAPGEVVIFEPDFRSMPIVFVDSVATTLRHLRMHKEVADSVDLLPMFPTILTSGFVCDNIGAEFFVERLASIDAADSGVFVGCNDATHSHNDVRNLRRLSLYEIFLKWPATLPYLALPTGTLVTVTAFGPEFYLNQRPLTIKRSSYLDRLYAGR